MIGSLSAAQPLEGRRDANGLVVELHVGICTLIRQLLSQERGPDRSDPGALTKIPEDGEPEVAPPKPIETKMSLKERW
jgi:hypothetical protein